MGLLPTPRRWWVMVQLRFRSSAVRRAQRRRRGAAGGHRDSVAASSDARPSTPEGIKGAWEGILYTQIVLPVMIDRLADQGFEGAAYLDDWYAYLDAIVSDDADAAVALSEDLCVWNCVLQQELGIVTCTASEDQG